MSENDRNDNPEKEEHIHIEIAKCTSMLVMDAMAEYFACIEFLDVDDARTGQSRSMFVQCILHYFIMTKEDTTEEASFEILRRVAAGQVMMGTTRDRLDILEPIFEEVHMLRANKLTGLMN